MNAVVVSSGSLPATAQEIKALVQRIQQVMKSVMKDGTHFGVVPGTPKPSLWKPGAEVLQATFHIAPSYRVEDISDRDCVRYRVTCIGTHQSSSVVLGEGLGECSSNEEKYKWKACRNNKEYEATDDTRKRIKYGWDNNAKVETETRQIRVEPADVANTVLKMACKRAQIAMVLNVTAASDIFTQDLEDLPEGMGGEAGQARPRSAPRSTNRQGGSITEKQLNLLKTKLGQAEITAEELCKKFEIESLDKLPFDRMNEALDWIKDPS